MPDNFSHLLNAIRRVFPAAQLTPLQDTEVAAIRTRFPDTPEHYLEFLRHVGYGSLSGNFMLYNGLVEPDEIFDTQTANDLAGIVFIGDNFAGWMVGFEIRNGWRLVAVDSCGLTPVPEQAETLGEFIAQRLADYESA